MFHGMFQRELAAIMAEHIDNDPDPDVPAPSEADELAAWHLALDEAALIRESRAWAEARVIEHRMDSEHAPY